MKKSKLFACLLALVMVAALVLAGCGGGGSSSAPADSPAADASTPPADDGSAAEGDDGGEGGYRVAMITNAPIADGGWNTAVYGAMVEAADARGWKTAYSENVAQNDYVPQMGNYAMQGFDLIIAPGNEFSDAVMEVSEMYPDTMFVLNNGEYEAPNVMSLMADNHQIGFIAGACAAIQSQTRSVGFIGGMEITTGVQARESFELGAKYVDPDIQVSTAMAGSWDDTAKGKEIALSMISTNDVDVIFGVASAIDTGARIGLSEHENRWHIAQPADLLDDDPDIIITSMVTSTARLYELSMEEVENGTFGGKTISGDLSNGVVSIGRYGTAFSEENQKKLEEIAAGVADGSIPYKP